MYKGILFDMDNTLLQSRINFKQMREALITFIVQQGLAQHEAFKNDITPAQVIEHGKKLQGTSASLEREMWGIVERYEALGMSNVTLEEGALSGITQLKERGYRLAVVTNNAYSAACTALEKTNISSFFELVVGREQMVALKPSPSGILYALENLACSPHHCVMVGDSWIDGKAAIEAHIDFIAYKAKLDLMAQQKVEPVLSASCFKEVVKWIEK